MSDGTMAAVIEDQPPPIPNESTPIWELVVADMVDRDRVGTERYGTPLQTNNGRDPLVDLYQEMLDAVVYVRQYIAERAQRRAAAEAGELDEDLVRRIAQGMLDVESAALHRSPHALTEMQRPYIERLLEQARAVLTAVE